MASSNLLVPHSVPHSDQIYLHIYSHSPKLIVGDAHSFYPSAASGQCGVSHGAPTLTALLRLTNC